MKIIAVAVTVTLLWAQVHAAEPGERIGPAWEDSRNPILKTFGGERIDLWSLRPVRTPDMPNEPPAWARQPLDTFVFASLAEQGKHPAGEADLRTLARRLHFQLVGLPPTPEEMQALLTDDRPDTYERLVDRLLASPAHGQHLARLWLDVVRYSDSNGFDWDEYRKQAWRYRDYVIRSLNADKPFAQFVQEQLAGDELLDGPPKNRAEQDALLATGYLRMGPQDNAASLFNEQSRARHELLVDLVETTSSAFLGLTFSCCRCHDHKYDPFSQADYYRLRAFFEPVKFGDGLPLNLATELGVIDRQNGDVDKRLDKLNAQQRDLLSAAKERAKGMAKEDVSDETAIKHFTDEEKEQRKALDKEIRRLLAKKKSPDQGLLMTDDEGETPPTRLLTAGDHQSPAGEVVPGFPSVLDPNAVDMATPTNPKTKGRRLTLAHWITNKNNPWTYRVISNRLWQWHFSTGLVATANDFGLSGARPGSPAALDWLANDTGDNGSLKRLERIIVTSSTFRQTGHFEEPADELAALQPLIRRLSAEQLRDALLQVSGLLTTKHSGPPIWPDLPPEVLQANPAFLDDNAEKVKGWYPSPLSAQYARSIFLIQKRTVRIPFLETFDLPENAVSCARRNTSTVAPQALTLLNSSLAIACAQGFGQRVVSLQAKSPEAQIKAAYQLALQRDPTDKEREECLQFLKERSLAELCRVLLNLNEFCYLD